jgi:hypothetical protein
MSTTAPDPDGAFDAATAQVQGVFGGTHIEQDYAGFLEMLFTTAAPTTGWHVIVDNLNTHLSESVVRRAARLCKIEDDLSEKGKSGVLASMLAREALLRDPSQRICSYVTPKHASWLQPSRDLVFDPHPQAAAARELCTQAISEGADRGLHRLLQPHPRQAVQVDHDGQTARRLSAGEMGSGLPAGLHTGS